MDISDIIQKSWGAYKTNGCLTNSSKSLGPHQAFTWDAQYSQCYQCYWIIHSLCKNDHPHIISHIKPKLSPKPNHVQNWHVLSHINSVIAKSTQPNGFLWKFNAFPECSPLKKTCFWCMPHFQTQQNIHFSQLNLRHALWRGSLADGTGHAFLRFHDHVAVDQYQ